MKCINLFVTLIIKLGIVLGITLGPSMPATGAGIPVFDPQNYYRNLMAYTQSLAAAQTLAKQYQTQLQQYQNMQLNTTAPARQIWQDASTSIQQLKDAMNSVNYYKKKLGSLEAYLGKFSDTKNYKNSRCYSSSGCSDAEWSAWSASRDLGNESQKQAVDTLYRGLDQQHTSLQNTADNLANLQTEAKDARGQLAALSYANQFANQIATELMQIRALLIAQQGLLAARGQALANKEAQEAAASAYFWSDPFTPASQHGK